MPIEYLLNVNIYLFGTKFFYYLYLANIYFRK